PAFPLILPPAIRPRRASRSPLRSDGIARRGAAVRATMPTEPEIRLYNTATRRKDVLTPVNPGQVGVYVCGPTVYDRAHIGNARPVVVFDVLFRLLRHVYGVPNGTYVRRSEE